MGWPKKKERKEGKGKASRVGKEENEKGAVLFDLSISTSSIEPNRKRISSLIFCTLP